MLRGITWSTLVAPGWPQSQHTLLPARTWARSRRQGLPLRPAVRAVMTTPVASAW